MPPRDPDLPVVFGRGDTTAVGMTNGQVSRRVASRSWTRLRRGRYAVTAGLQPERRWRAEIAAHVAAHRRPLVLSHAHAALAWGLPAPLDGCGAPTFTCASGPTRGGGIRIRVAPLEHAECAVMGAVVVTAPARTVVDCARTLPGRDGLAIADAALALGLVTPGELADALRRADGWPGVCLARRVVALADGRRESPLESWSAWSFDEQGVPAPLWQVEICDEAGVSLGRADSWWREGLVGEADGKAKYRMRALERGGAPSEALAAVLDAERIREMRFRRTHALVVRWVPRDVLVSDRAAALAVHIRHELAAARTRRFTGSVHLP